MTRFHALVLAGMLSLLGSTASAALARPMLAGSPAPQSRPLQVAHSYFAVLNAGMRTGDFSSLASVYAPNAQLTVYRYLARDIAPEKIGEAHGLAAITVLYWRISGTFPGYRWTQIQVTRVSNTRVVSYERVRSPGGSIAESETVLVIKGGKITRLAWTVDFGLQK
jgi:hypothetical protein